MLKDFAIHYYTGRSTPQMDVPGEKRVYEFKIFYKTDAGEFEPEQWRERALREIESEGQTELLNKITAHVRTHCAWLCRETEIIDYAMDCLCSGAYQAWEDFGERTIIWM